MAISFHSDTNDICSNYAIALIPHISKTMLCMWPIYKNKNFRRLSKAGKIYARKRRNNEHLTANSSRLKLRVLREMKWKEMYDVLTEIDFQIVELLSVVVKTNERRIHSFLRRKRCTPKKLRWSLLRVKTLSEDGLHSISAAIMKDMITDRAEYFPKCYNSLK